MAPFPELDEELQAKVLAFVTVPRASAACSAWKEQLYMSLHLECQSIFHTRLHGDGKILFCYNAVRPLGEDFEESVVYDFSFAPDRTYSMRWTRTFDAWSIQCEQQVGRWSLVFDQVNCETFDPKQCSETEIRYAPPGYTFQVPIGDILKANGTSLQAPSGSPAACWELPCRTGKHQDQRTFAGMWQTVQVEPAATRAPAVTLRPDARFVEIDGEVHEVSGDIVANWPEQDWVRLMRCRLRFGNAQLYAAGITG
jgi:hypothetical protein